MNFTERQIEAHRNQAMAAEKTRQMILRDCTPEEIMNNKHLKEAMGW